MDGHDYRLGVSRFLKGVVTTPDSHKFPAVSAEDFAHLFSRDNPQSSISCTWAPADSAFASRVARSTWTSIQSSAASRMFEMASSSVSPCEWHPGIAGTLTEYPPSASGWRRTFSFISGLMMVRATGRPLALWQIPPAGFEPATLGLGNRCSIP